MRYPAEPLEPSYYAQLLATASSMSEEEQRARAVMEPRETPRGDRDRPRPEEVTLDVEQEQPGAQEEILGGDRESMRASQMLYC